MDAIVDVERYAKRQETCPNKRENKLIVEATFKQTIANLDWLHKKILEIDAANNVR